MFMYKIIIAGGRNFKDYVKFCEVCDKYITALMHNLKIIEEDIEIVSGAAKGVDSMAIMYARQYGYKIKEFPADWDTHGKSAGYIRNKQMADYADALIAFWDGVSRGTANMIEVMHKLGKPARVINY